MSGCERARTWASLLPDGELSELERRLLASHLARCSACTSFAASVETFVTAIRAVPLEPMPESAHAVVWRRRSTTPAVRVAGRVGSVAAAAAAGALAFSLGGTLGDGERVTAPRTVVVELAGTNIAQELDALRDARRVELLSTVPEPVAGEHSGPNPL